MEKETFQRLFRKNIEAYVESYKKEPDDKALELLRQITITEIAFIKAAMNEDETIQ